VNGLVDKNFAMSSFLALRYIEKRDVDFADNIKYRHPNHLDGKYTFVETANDIGKSIEKQIDEICGRYKKLGILLSGGMDSAILASFLPKCDAYTFRFMGGDFQKEELNRAEKFAEYCGHKLHYVDIDWDKMLDALTPVMQSKGGPVHSIEPQIYRGAIEAKTDGVDLMIIGDGSDYVFGGMDKLLSKDWGFEEFYHRYIYVEPEEVLNDPQSIRYLFERYRDKDNIDYKGFMDIVATEESYGSYSNAFIAAGLDYYDPYAILKMSKPLDLARIRSGESKYLIRELFKQRYPDIPVPEKVPMPRPVDLYFADWKGPHRPEFREDIEITKYSGNQKWLIWCLEKFLDMYEKACP